jgi:holliday junction DNA helicase RuvA
LTTAQGVDARLALAILSVLAPGQLGLAILAQNKVALTQADGVGMRLAASIVDELHDRNRVLLPVVAALVIRTAGIQ